MFENDKEPQQKHIFH